MWMVIGLLVSVIALSIDWNPEEIVGTLQGILILGLLGAAIMLRWVITLRFWSALVAWLRSLADAAEQAVSACAKHGLWRRQMPSPRASRQGAALAVSDTREGEGKQHPVFRRPMKARSCERVEEMRQGGHCIRQSRSSMTTVR